MQNKIRSTTERAARLFAKGYMISFVMDDFNNTYLSTAFFVQIPQKNMQIFILLNRHMVGKRSKDQTIPPSTNVIDAPTPPLRLCSSTVGRYGTISVFIITQHSNEKRRKQSTSDVPVSKDNGDRVDQVLAARLPHGRPF